MLLLIGQAGAMRLINGKLYLGSRTYYGAQQAEYVVFNLYGDDMGRFLNVLIGPEDLNLL